MNNAKLNPPPTRGCVIYLLCGATALFGLAVLFAVLLAVRNAHWEASKLTRVRDAVVEMKAKRGHRLPLYAARNLDAQLEQIRGMPEIEDIHVYETDLTSEGMKHIGTLPNLKRVTVFALVGDEGLLALGECKSLEWVDIYDRSITPEAIAELQSRLPGATINTIYEPIEDRHPPTQAEAPADAPDTPPDSN